MTEQQNENELIAQLSSDKRSLVIQAIVKLSRSGKTKAELEALAPFINSKDREISFFSFQAAGKIAKKAGINLDKFIEGFKQLPAAPEQLSRQELLSPDKDRAQTILSRVRELGADVPKDLLPAVAVFLSRYGDISDSPFLERALIQEDSNLSLTFIGAAEKIAPAVLTRALPNLLASREPLVRSRSISALRRIDPEEAERHFSDLLASRNPEDRLAGIGIAFLFPFPRVKGYILSTLPEELDTDVLKAIQTFLASNPELECALEILDSIDAVPPEQKRKLSIIFRTVCQAIGATGIMTPEAAAPEEVVKIWKKQRLEKFLNDLEIQLSFSDEKKKAALISWIEKNRKHPKVQELIERLARNPQTENVFFQLTRPAPEGEQPTQAIPKPATAPTPSLTDDAQQKFQIMRKMELDSFPANRSWILKEAESGSPELRREALGTLLRLHPDNKLKNLAKTAINDSDQIVKIAGFQILERIDQDYLREIICELLQEDDANIRVRAVRFALKFKESEAIDILKNLLKSPEHRIRANAIACLGLCPFASSYKILLDQLDQENHPVIAKHLTSILLANPSRLTLKGLDNITRTSNPAVAMVISQARNDLFEIVSRMPEEKIQDQDKNAQESSDKPYSVENVRNISRNKQKTWKPGYKADKVASKKIIPDDFNWPMAISGAVLICFLGLLPIMLLSDRGGSKAVRGKTPKDWRENERKKFSGSKVPQKFRMNKPCSVSATVEKITSDTSMVVRHDENQIMIKFETPELKNVQEGTELIVTMVPYRVNPRGIILARGTSLAISKGQEK